MGKTPHIYVTFPSSYGNTNKGEFGCQGHLSLDREPTHSYVYVVNCEQKRF